MKARIFTLPFDPLIGRFDDSLLVGFLADKELIGLRDHFFQHEGRPHLALVVEYRLPELEAASQSDGGTTQVTKAPHWRELIEAGDVPLFNELRQWRGEKAKEEGVPRYVICNNRELAELIRQRPRSLNKLAEIGGFGSAKVRKYGADLLRLLSNSPESVAMSKASAEAAPTKEPRDG